VKVRVETAKANGLTCLVGRGHSQSSGPAIVAAPPVFGQQRGRQGAAECEKVGG